MPRIPRTTAPRRDSPPARGESRARPAPRRDSPPTRGESPCPNLSGVDHTMPPLPSPPLATACPGGSAHANNLPLAIRAPQPPPCLAVHAPLPPRLPLYACPRLRPIHPRRHTPGEEICKDWNNRGRKSARGELGILLDPAGHRNPRSGSVLGSTDLPTRAPSGWGTRSGSGSSARAWGCESSFGLRRRQGEREREREMRGRGRGRG
jgi:hypothetical protein